MKGPKYQKTQSDKVPKEPKTQIPNPAWVLGCLGVFLLLDVCHGAEPVKGGARQLQLAARPSVLSLAPMPSFVEPPPATNTYTLKWVTFDYSTDPSTNHSVSLAWVPSTASGVSTNRIYHGNASRNYTNMSVVVTNSGTVDGLAGGLEHFFAVTAVDAIGIESEFSNEVSFTAPPSGTPGNIRVTAGAGGATAQDVTNAVISVGTSPGRIDWIFDVGATNRFAISNLLYGVDYYVCIQAEQISGIRPISAEFRWPPPEPPLEVYVKTTLQYSNVTTGLWEDRFSDVVTNLVGRQFRRMRIGGPTNTPSASTKAQQTAANPLGPWVDLTNTVSVLVGRAEDHPKARFDISMWNNQTNNLPYIFPEQ